MALMFCIALNFLSEEGPCSATIHDLAQVVDAGFSISQETGDIATVVKLIRVANAVPVILVVDVIIRRIGANDGSADRPAIVPGFVVAFVILVAMNSFGVFSQTVTAFAAEISRWALLTAIAAIGLKTSLSEVAKVGLPAIALLVTEAVFIGGPTIPVLKWMI